MRLERFVTRLRIVASHSLAADRELLVLTSEHKWDILVTRTEDGSPSYAFKPISLLPVEQIESAIVRVRPLILDGDGISYKPMFRAIGEGLSAEERAEIAVCRAEFAEFDPDAGVGKPKEPHAPGTPITNTRIAGSWLYGDLVHADAIRQTYNAQVTLEQVFVEAQRMTSGLVLASLHALDVLKVLHGRGRLDVDAGVFTREVTVSATSWAPSITAVHVAEEGTPPPTSFDEPLGEEWSPL